MKPQPHPHIWRCIESSPANGALNMSVDEALFSSFDPINSLPVFRVYSWAPPALSIGRFQNSSKEIDLERCELDNLMLVRRITGGGALYHADELTYSIVCSAEQIPNASSVKDSFRILTGFLLDFYCGLGLNASYAVDSVSGTVQLGCRTSFCYAGKESFDILVDGRKIGGNAQRRRKSIVFQHGSIPITDCTMIGLRYMTDCSPRYASDSATLSGCGVDNDLDALKRALVESFGRRMNADMHASRLTPEEDLLSKKLLVEKYSGEHWNLRSEIR